MDEAIDVLWNQVLERWDEEKRHQAFLQYCVERRALAEAARRYRVVAEIPPLTEASAREEKDESPYRAAAGNKEDAQRRLASIALLAVGALDAERTTPSASRIHAGLRVFAALFLIAALVGLGWMFAVSYGGGR